ncbi:MAG TPA: hypothetical protein VMV40_02435 [Acidiferrobacter sp.]|nr:hypothetical protein [Acidiferrobacter sp.]
MTVNITNVSVLGEVWALFDHEYFDVYPFEAVPLSEDSYLMDERYIEEYELAMLDTISGGESANVGYISYIAARRINDRSIDLSWYPNIYDRFHEVPVLLPKEQFVACVGCWRYGEKPRIFVKSTWLEQLHLRLYSVFCMVDAIGVKDALQRGALSRERLVALRDAIDEVAKQYPEVSFISFADRLLLKSNWSVGHFRSDVSYTYRPEVFVKVVKDIREIYRDILELDVYAIMTQGSNEYYEDSLLHISESENHICLNSLGLPFAQLMSIDNSVHSAIKKRNHNPSELYLDAQFLHSLRFRLQFDKKSLGQYAYHDKMMSTCGHYYCVGWEELLENLDPDSDER